MVIPVSCWAFQPYFIAVSRGSWVCLHNFLTLEKAENRTCHCYKDVKLNNQGFVYVYHKWEVTGLLSCIEPDSVHSVKNGL